MGNIQMKNSLLIITATVFFLNSAGVGLACTGFTASNDNNRVLVGNNEDWYQYDFWIRFLPAENGKYGRMIIENHWPISPNSDWHCPQGGMNDQGLFYDCFATASLLPIESVGKPYYHNSEDHYMYSLESYCLSICSTIDEVVELYDKYNLQHMERYQVLWVDKNGDSVIIEGDDTVFKEGNYQVVTNFIQTRPELGGYPCWRYDTAVRMLEEMDEISIEYFTAICDAAHNTGTYPSVYSNVYDLNNGILYLYYFYNYDHVVEINLEEELALGDHVYFLEDLFESSNLPPNKPSTPTGPSTGKKGEECVYQSHTSDPDEDHIHYLFDWGDGTDSGWLGPYSSGALCEATHSWKSQGTYTVKVKAKDSNGYESEWSDPLSVAMPKNKLVYIRPLLCHFIELVKVLFPSIRLAFS